METPTYIAGECQRDQAGRLYEQARALNKEADIILKKSLLKHGWVEYAANSGDKYYLFQTEKCVLVATSLEEARKLSCPVTQGQLKVFSERTFNV